MKKKLLLIRIIGMLFLVIGLISLFAVPAEFTSFYAFTNGGAYQYHGFGFGSLMFAVILFSSLLYEVVAMIFIPVGIGNIRLTYWGYRATNIFFLTLIAIGFASTICIGGSSGLLNTFSASQYIAILIIPAITFIVLPYLLLRFYKNQKTIKLFSVSCNMTFENQSAHKIVSILLNMVWVMLFAAMILLKGAFPFLGNYIFGSEGTYILSAMIFTVFVLNYLYYRNFRFSKYCMIVFYVFLILSFIVTFIVIQTKDFISLLDLPDYEMQEMATGLKVASGINPGFFFGVLLAIQTFLLLLGDKRFNDLFLKSIVNHSRKSQGAEPTGKEL